MKKTVISEMTNVVNEKIFCQLILAIFKDQLKYKLVDDTLPFNDSAASKTSTEMGNIFVEVIDTPYSISIEFNYVIENIKSYFGGSRELPPDPDEFFLERIDIKKVNLYKKETEYNLSTIYPVNVFSEYLICSILMDELIGLDVSNLIMKLEKKIDSSFGKVNVSISYLKGEIVTENKVVKEDFGQIKNNKKLILYHATNKKFLDKIYKEGITPSIPSKLPNSESLVWTADTKEIAISHAKRKYPENEIIVLTLKIDPKKQKVFHAMASNVYTIEGVVDPKNIIKNTINELKESGDQRYIVTMDFYIHTKDDKSAIELAKQIAEKQVQKYDNSATILKIEHQPWGTLESKLIWGKE
jgi:hypothetical protein